jgi:radical SAM superfamily enzyme YgiQ (UPF0313 family)
MADILLFIPPLTQLNTPYPATAYLTGFLRQQGISCTQGDLGLDLVLELFTQSGLKGVFDAIEEGNHPLPHAFSNMVLNRKAYEQTIDPVIAFLQNRNYTLAYQVVSRRYLPEAGRFRTVRDLELFFGSNGVQDKARFLCSLYLEDLADLIQATVGPHFGIARYGERIARTAVSFVPVREALEAPQNYVDTVLLRVLSRYFEQGAPRMAGFTVPFPGNLYGALKCGQWIRQHHPGTRVVMGGGYANTELRELSDPGVFDFVDYITLDDGENPLLALYRHITDPEGHPFLKRTYVRRDNEVKWVSTLAGGDVPQGRLPAPDYGGLRTREYLSMFDMPNPMHRLWNDGRWNKMTIAHGCYWKKCSFCDVSLDYISRFEQTPAVLLADRMQTLMDQTGESGFHFVDEAAPPLAMRDLAIEILRRGMQVTWWTNIRFEKTFTPDLSRLLAASGCVAVTGGLEVASPRLLELMEKGITIEQVARVCAGFRDAGILVHAYLMYGFPTQTEQETVDSLEVVRQLFEHGLIQSGFWHQFAMTVHSPVGLNPEKYGVIRTGPEFRGFANNDLYHEDPTGADHEKFSDGLKKALYNYMHRNAFDFPLQKFFSFPVPKPFTHPKLVSGFFKRPVFDDPGQSGYVMMWHQVAVTMVPKDPGMCELIFVNPRRITRIVLPAPAAEMIQSKASRFEVAEGGGVDFAELVSGLASCAGLTPEETVRTEWYLRWRKEVVWVIKSPAR